MKSAIDLVRRFRAQSLLVVGDAMLDVYFYGRATRLCVEGPVPVVEAKRKICMPGGAGNVAVNVRALGGKAMFLSVIGQDETGRHLWGELERRGVPTGDLIVDPKYSTLRKLRVLAEGQYVARFDEGEGRPLRSVTPTNLRERFSELWQQCDAVLISDYAYGTIDRRLIALLNQLNRTGEKLVVVDSKQLEAFRGCRLTVITPNQFEAQRVLDWEIVGDGRIKGKRLERLGRRLLQRIPARWAIVTLGAEGSCVFDQNGGVYRVSPRPVAHPHIAGAGDTFAAALTLTLAAGGDIQTAAELAADAAAIAVSKEGTAATTRQELLQRLSRASPLNDGIASLLVRLERERRAGKRIVFTNGCFDILHSGHVTYLRQARRLGDVLVVGVNSDESVRRLKGNSRPINREEDRLSVIAALECVDYAVLFNEDTPERLIRLIRPHVHAKGGDYSPDELPEAEAAAVRDVGGEVILLPLVEGRSTTAIVQKIARLAAEEKSGVQRRGAGSKDGL